MMMTSLRTAIKPRTILFKNKSRACDDTLASSSRRLVPFRTSGSSSTLVGNHLLAHTHMHSDRDSSSAERFLVECTSCHFEGSKEMHAALAFGVSGMLSVKERSGPKGSPVSFK